MKKPERNAGGLSHTQAELHKKQCDNPDIGPVLGWKEWGNRPFGPEVCSVSAQLDIIGTTGICCKLKMAF